MKIKNFFEDYTELPKSIFILFFAQIVSSIGSFVFPFLTIFFTKTLLYSEQQAGFYVMLATGAKIPGLLLGGKLVDIFGRKRIFVIFSTISALFILSCLIVQKKEIIPWLLVLSAVFNGANYPALKAMAADLTNPDNRKAAFSLLYLGLNIGFVVGPLVAGLLYNNYLNLSLWAILSHHYCRTVDFFLIERLFLYRTISKILLFLTAVRKDQSEEHLESIAN